MGWSAAHLKRSAITPARGIFVAAMRCASARASACAKTIARRRCAHDDDGRRLRRARRVPRISGIDDRRPIAVTGRCPECFDTAPPFLWRSAHAARREVAAAASREAVSIDARALLKATMQNEGRARSSASARRITIRHFIITILSSLPLNIASIMIPPTPPACRAADAADIMRRMKPSYFTRRWPPMNTIYHCQPSQPGQATLTILATLYCHYLPASHLPLFSRRRDA